MALGPRMPFVDSKRPEAQDLPRPRLLTMRLVLAAILLFGLWSGGLIWFAADMPRRHPPPDAVTDAIVVLTGGSDRLATAFTLLAEKRAKKLFVSGVHRGTDKAELFRRAHQSPAALDCCVELGYDAADTVGNAEEAALWIKREGFTSLRLVTASYHMRRSLLEFGYALPGVEILAHPVFPEAFKRDEWWLWPGSAALVIGEYHKYLAALIRHAAKGKEF